MADREKIMKKQRTACLGYSSLFSMFLMGKRLGNEELSLPSSLRLATQDIRLLGPWYPAPWALAKTTGN